MTTKEVAALLGIGKSTVTYTARKLGIGGRTADKRGNYDFSLDDVEIIKERNKNEQLGKGRGKKKNIFKNWVTKREK